MKDGLFFLSVTVCIYHLITTLLKSKVCSIWCLFSC